ncbi:MAG: pyruvate, phosphate dikinase [Candidatus Eisenbacteria bacterium]|nr:pyruvate, phosphate dikinase [Candidatus Eisenbacteria bacterium]
MATKHVYFFGGGEAEGRGDMKSLLGGKGANLAEMTNIGIPVPAGFTISTEVCTHYYERGKEFPEGLREEVGAAIHKVEAVMGATFGDAANPLLFSVRSGARASMPGMMDTVLNIGLNDATAAGLIAKTGDDRFVYDSYRRLIEMYADVVMGLDIKEFHALLDAKKKEKGVWHDVDLAAADLKALAADYKRKVREISGRDFPDDPHEQLWGAVRAVFESWNVPRAVSYRRLYDIPDDWGTAVNVQAMVFGNMGEGCATGVAFTRDPATGERVFYGEYLENAQGEDVVSGVRTPHPINLAQKKPGDEPSLEETMPEIYHELEAIRERLERHYTDTQDIEFTVQRGRLWMLQTRTGKRTAQAAVRIAVEMEQEGLIDRKTAVLRVDPEQLEQLLHKRLDPAAKYEALTKGLPASPGAAVGRVVFTAQDAVRWAEAEAAADPKEQEDHRTILVREETSPEDIDGMNAAQGFLTARGGMTSHAAVVARGMGKCCIAGASDVKIDYASRTFSVGKTVVKEGDWVTLNGSTGEVVVGKVPTVEPEMSGHFATLMGWADEFRQLAVRTNADTPADAALARQLGAEGIGLCRTEHMFFGKERVKHIRAMIMAANETERRESLAKLLPFQRKDFEGILEAMQGLTVTIRLLDPPLHEFVPHTDREIEDLARELGRDPAALKAKAASLREANPMLGHRGCRLGVTYPEIYEMQVRAIYEAACALANRGVDVRPEVMIPLVGEPKELSILRELAERVGNEITDREGVELPVVVGTMIEVPRAALVADEIAEHAEFFSFGTNDLTQMTYGYSRDDTRMFMKDYLKKGILRKDPFQSLDRRGVGSLIKTAVDKGRLVNADLHVGICGEHGGDPASIQFCHHSGLDYVSCSPYRVPVARLAAAHAVLKARMKASL